MLETLPCNRQGLTPFTFSRFLIPYLKSYLGWAIFLDIDIMVRGDLAELWKLRDEKYAAMVVKHEMAFERASVMLLNCHKLGQLTPDYVNTADGLHKLSFLKEEEIGELPHEWNHLVGYDPPRPDAKLAHFTQGVPIFPETKDSEYAADWMKYARAAASTISWAELMGNSVHARPVLERLNKEANNGQAL